MESREAIRRTMRQRRRALSSAQRRAVARRICKNLCTSLLFLHSRRIGCYLANDGEPDLAPVIARCSAMGKRCYLPALHPLGHNRLDFLPYRPGERLIPNKYRIPEPVDRSGTAPPWALDLLLLPLVAFDAKGDRLGMGGGYYDRTLAYLHQRKYWRAPRLLGVAHQFQQVDDITPERWDVPLDGVVTDAKIIFFNPALLVFR